MRKSITKSISVLVAAFLICIMLPMGVFADWNASDVITITVDVFDVSANQIYRNVGTDTITKGDQYIQSDHYRIPELSQFTSASYGRIQKVTGNWYGYYESANVGTNVVFSCNSDTARITYYVSYYGTAAEGRRFLRQRQRDRGQRRLFDDVYRCLPLELSRRNRLSANLQVYDLRRLSYRKYRQNRQH